MWTRALRSSLTSATALRVRSGGTCHRNVETEQVLLRIEDREAVATLVALVEIEDTESGGHCMCCGDPTLEFYNGDTLLLSLGFHHGRILRWADGQWPGDGLLTKTSAQKLRDWFEEQGVLGPKQQHDGIVASRRESEAAAAKWLRAMPASLKPFWPAMGNPFAPANIGQMRAALVQEFPVEPERILVLFAWYGCGKGPWSGFPTYEQAAEKLLLQHETATLLGALRGRQLTTEQTEGVARLFGGWAFSKERPGDLRLLSPQLRQKLLEHSLECDDGDKRSRASKAFRDA